MSTDPDAGYWSGPWPGEDGGPRRLGVPEDRRARTLVSLGYPTEEGARPKSAPGVARRPLAEMVRFERFS